MAISIAQEAKERKTNIHVLCVCVCMIGIRNVVVVISFLCVSFPIVSTICGRIQSWPLQTLTSNKSWNLSGFKIRANEFEPISLAVLFVWLTAIRDQHSISTKHGIASFFTYLLCKSHTQTTLSRPRAKKNPVRLWITINSLIIKNRLNYLSVSVWVCVLVVQMKWNWLFFRILCSFFSNAGKIGEMWLFSIEISNLLDFRVHWTRSNNSTNLS